MRASESTYLAQLGFADGDKKNPAHNITCQYLAQPEKLEKLADQFLTSGVAPEGDFERTGDVPVNAPTWVNLDYKVKYTYSDIRKEFGYHLSPPLKQQNGNFLRIIGYLDLLVECKFLAKLKKEWQHKQIQIGDEYFDRVCISRGTIAVEVKSGYTPVTDVIQQIATYKTFGGFDAFVLCTNYKIDSNYKSALNNAGIGHIYVPESELVIFNGKSEEINQTPF